jgi:hypothetical protein
MYIISGGNSDLDNYSSDKIWELVRVCGAGQEVMSSEKCSGNYFVVILFKRMLNNV